MNKLILLLLATVLHTAAETVSVQFISLSPQIFPAKDEDPLTDLEWNLSLSSLGNPNFINHEVKLSAGNHGFSHEGTFILLDPTTFEPYRIPFVLDLPPLVDANANGLDDFFDSTMAVESVTTQGRHPNFNGGGEDFSATWSRPAGESWGYVTLHFPFFDLRFEHGFQLAHYLGKFDYERTATNLSGSIALTNVFDPQDKIIGPLSVRVLDTNTLSYSALAWNNGADSQYVITTNMDFGHSSTNFISYWELEDGYVSTGGADYLDWLMVISSGDENANGQLDLVEGNSNPAERPSLGLVKLPTGSIEITLRGTPGLTYVLESAPAIAGASWQNVQTVTLASATQTVSVPASGTGRFFRLRQQ